MRLYIQKQGRQTFRTKTQGKIVTVSIQKSRYGNIVETKSISSRAKCSTPMGGELILGSAYISQYILLKVQCTCIMREYPERKRSDSRSQVRQHSFVTGPPQVTKMCTKNILRLWPLPTGLARPYTVPRLSYEMHGIIGDVGFRATVVCLSSPNLFGDCDLACSDVSTP